MTMLMDELTEEPDTWYVCDCGAAYRSLQVAMMCHIGKDVTEQSERERRD